MMDESRPEAVVARVVAWHNRHPLARRLKAEQVQAVGVVALPFVAPADAGARPSKPAFSEDFLPPRRPAAVVRWAARHGAVDATWPAAWPLRTVAADGNDPTVTVMVLSAAIEAGAQRGRVLLGMGANAAVLGRRLWSRPRLAAAGAGLLASLALAATAVGVALLPAPTVDPLPAVAAVAAAQSVSTTPAASAAARVAPRADAAAVAGAPASAAPRLHAAASASDADLPVAEVAILPASAATPGLPPDDPAPRPDGSAPPVQRPAAHPSSPGVPSGRPAVVSPLVASLSGDERLAARDAVDAARARVRGTAVPAPRSQPAASAAQTADAPSRATAGAPTGPLFALSTRRLRTRTEAEQVMAAMGALLHRDSAAGGAIRVEILAAGDDWQVAAYPYGRQAEAERAQALLASRGMRVGVVAF